MLAEWLTLFKSLGFSETETKVYLACLELGPAAAQDIAKKAKVSRVTTYIAIETLTDRGLMSSFMKEKRKRFVVESPERLISYAEGRIKYAEDAVVQAKEVMEDLKAIQKGERPVVKIFEGPDALKAVQQDMLDSKPETIDEFGNIDSIVKVYSTAKDLDPFLKKLSQLEGVKERRSILLKRTNLKDYPEPQLKRVNLSPEDYNFTGDILVYANKIAISTFKGKQISVVIESNELAKTFKSFFDFALRKK